MGKYYLVVRYRKNNFIQIVELKKSWYLKGQSLDEKLRANNLEAIDLVTTRFQSSHEMLKKMYENHYIQSMNADIYIASKRRKNGQEYIRDYEIIYNDSSSRINNFRDIASSSLQNEISIEFDKIRDMYDEFADKLFYNSDFSFYLKSGCTDIPEKIVKLFINSSKTKPAYNIKYENNWLFHNYEIVRSVASALERFERVKNIEDASVLRDDKFNRRKVIDKLLMKLDSDYIEGQYSLFDDEQEVQDSTLEENRVESLENKDDLKVSFTDKKDFILDTIKNLPITLFSQKNNKYVVNLSFFGIYPTNEDRNCLGNLSSTTVKCIYFYLLYYEKYQEASLNYQNTISLEEELRSARKRFQKVLDSEKSVSKLYEWINTYFKCLKFNELVYGDLQLEEGKKYGKK